MSFQGGEMPSGEVTNIGRSKGGNNGFRGKPSLLHWMVVSIQVSVSGSICQILQIMFALIVLSSITKKGKTVTNMAPFRPFRVILVIE